MTPNQVELARHALGLNGRLHRSYRNYFCAGKDHRDFADWLAMVETGDAIRREGVPGCGGDDIFHLTLEGASKALRRGEKLDPEDFPGGET